MMEPTVVTYRLVSPKGTELLEILKELIFVGFFQGPRELSVYLNAGVREVSFDCTHKL